jgi:hypothetical protein
MLMAKIGSGGQSEVWRARDLVRREEVALKVLRPELAHSPEAWAVLEHEYAVTREVGHPGILKVYEPQRCEGVSMLPMALAPGGDLTTLRGESYSRIVPTLIEIAQALEHAHGRGVVHRDLKAGNVLLDADGHTLIADFGVASFSGGSPFADHGSPFSASPQALRGEAPSPSDDIYGLGALAYELLSGYPPFYPQFETQRVLEEPVAELKPTRPVPPRLVTLVMRLLSKAREARPATMREVIDELHASLHDTITIETETLEATAPAPAAPVTDDWVEMAERAPAAAAVRAAPVPPFVDAVAVAMIESRDTAAASAQAPALTVSAATDEEVVPLPPIVAPPATSSRGARRFDWRWAAAVVAIVAVLAVFFALPRFAPAPVTTATVTPDGAPATAKPAQAPAATRESVATLREGTEKRFTAIEARGAAIWGGADFAAVKAAMETAAVQVDDEDWAAATASYDGAGKRLAAVEGRAPTVLAEQLAAGDNAIAAGDPARARSAYALAQRIDPQSEPAAAGLQRAQALETALPLIAAAANADTAGDTGKAIDLYQQALAADPSNTVAREGLERVRAAANASDYARTLAAGFSALRADDLQGARESFERARSLQPGASAPQDGLQQVAAREQARAGDEARERAARLESAERWEEALRLYEDILARDATLEFARAGRDRSAPRADLARRLQQLIDRPERLGTSAVRADATRLLETARAAQPDGPVIRSQIARIELLLPAYDSPVRVALESDNATEVTIQRVGPLGTFLRREIELKPGRYTLTGTRLGYRDIRRDITIAPGTAVQTISVTCVEPI